MLEGSLFRALASERWRETGNGRLAEKKVNWSNASSACHRRFERVRAALKCIFCPIQQVSQKVGPRAGNSKMLRYVGLEHAIKVQTGLPLAVSPTRNTVCCQQVNAGITASELLHELLESTLQYSNQAVTRPTIVDMVSATDQSKHSGEFQHMLHSAVCTLEAEVVKMQASAPQSSVFVPTEALGKLDCRGLSIHRGEDGLVETLQVGISYARGYKPAEPGELGGRRSTWCPDDADLCQIQPITASLGALSTTSNGLGQSRSHSTNPLGFSIKQPPRYQPSSSSAWVMRSPTFRRRQAPTGGRGISGAAGHELPATNTPTRPSSDLPFNKLHSVPGAVTIATTQVEDSTSTACPCCDALHRATLQLQPNMMQLAQRLCGASKATQIQDMATRASHLGCDQQQAQHGGHQDRSQLYLDQMLNRALYNASAAGRCINPRWIATIAVCIPLARYMIEDESIDSHGLARYAKWLSKGVSILNRLLQRRGVGIHVDEADISQVLHGSASVPISMVAGSGVTHSGLLGSLNDHTPLAGLRTAMTMIAVLGRVLGQRIGQHVAIRKSARVGETHEDQDYVTATQSGYHVNPRPREAKETQNDTAEPKFVLDEAQLEAQLDSMLSFPVVTRLEALAPRPVSHCSKHGIMVGFRGLLDHRRTLRSPVSGISFSPSRQQWLGLICSRREQSLHQDTRNTPLPGKHTLDADRASSSVASPVHIRPLSMPRTAYTSKQGNEASQCTNYASSVCREGSVSGIAGLSLPVPKSVVATIGAPGGTPDFPLPAMAGSESGWLGITREDAARNPILAARRKEIEAALATKRELEHQSSKIATYAASETAEDHTILVRDSRHPQLPAAVQGPCLPYIASPRPPKNATSAYSGVPPVACSVSDSAVSASVSRLATMQLDRTPRAGSQRRVHEVHAQSCLQHVDSNHVIADNKRSVLSGNRKSNLRTRKRRRAVYDGCAHHQSGGGISLIHEAAGGSDGARHDIQGKWTNTLPQLAGLQARRTTADVEAHSDVGMSHKWTLAPIATGKTIEMHAPRVDSPHLASQSRDRFRRRATRIGVRSVRVQDQRNSLLPSGHLAANTAWGLMRLSTGSTDEYEPKGQSEVNRYVATIMEDVSASSSLGSSHDLIARVATSTTEAAIPVVSVNLDEGLRVYSPTFNSSRYDGDSHAESNAVQSLKAQTQPEVFEESYSERHKIERLLSQSCSPLSLAEPVYSAVSSDSFGSEEYEDDPLVASRVVDVGPSHSGGMSRDVAECVQSVVSMASSKKSSSMHSHWVSLDDDNRRSNESGAVSGPASMRVVSDATHVSASTCSAGRESASGSDRDREHD